jgi:signal transduction histidine kinase
MGFSFAESILVGGVAPISLALAAIVVPAPRVVRASLVTLGLLSCSALLVYFSGGYIEAHFHFFIVILIIGLYEDWLPLFLALVFVQLHHGITGALAPEYVFNHPSAQNQPWLWAGIHEAGIGVAAVLGIGAWKLNEELRAQKLVAAKARAVALADETRHRIERDLHDGMQQQMVSLALALRTVEATIPPEQVDTRAHISRVAARFTELMDELRQISSGIHPAILSEGGLRAALRVLARRSVVPVEVELRCDRRLDEEVELAAYYVVSEALTNAAKHAHASKVGVEVEESGEMLRLTVTDDGVGGANPAGGSGLAGLRDRVEALGGSIDVASTRGRGTRLTAAISCRSAEDAQDRSAAPRRPHLPVRIRRGRRLRTRGGTRA